MQRTGCNPWGATYAGEKCAFKEVRGATYGAQLMGATHGVQPMGGEKGVFQAGWGATYEVQPMGCNLWGRERCF